jgi:hypothetical protein
MRGFDTVSFVFGLEVTWSLIQQRQQEEEEKQAMLELEEAQKCDPSVEGDGGSSSDDDLAAGCGHIDKTEQANGDGDDNLATTSYGYIEGTEQANISNEECDQSDGSVDMTDAVESSTTAIRASDDSREACGDGTGVVVDSGETMSDTLGKHIHTAEVNAAASSEICSRDGREQTDKIVGNSDSDDSDDDSRQPCNQWICQACTFQNASSRKTCHMCRTKKSPPKKKRRVINDED